MSYIGQYRKAINDFYSFVRLNGSGFYTRKGTIFLVVSETGNTSYFLTGDGSFRYVFGNAFIDKSEKL